MKKPLLVIGLLVAIVYACNHGDRTLPVHNGDKRGIYAFIRNPAKVM